MGERTQGNTVNMKGKRWTVMPVVSAGGILDWYVIRGGINGAAFRDFVERTLVRSRKYRKGCCHRVSLDNSIDRWTRQIVGFTLFFVQLPHLRPFPQPNSVVIMDNFVTHHDLEVLDLIESTGAIVMFLPPYSPSYNPVSKRNLKCTSFVCVSCPC